MKAVVFESIFGEPLGGRRLDHAAKSARRSKADVVKEEDQDIWSALRRPQWFDRREFRVRIFRVVRGEADILSVRNWQNLTLDRADWVRH
jgi:hypothetical protein